MLKYIQRLMSCGYSPTDAYSTCYDFIKEFSLIELESFISSIEKEIRCVDRVQPKSDREKCG